jgi:hypothetical protein
LIVTGAASPDALPPDCEPPLLPLAALEPWLWHAVSANAKMAARVKDSKRLWILMNLNLSLCKLIKKTQLLTVFPI